MWLFFLSVASAFRSVFCFFALQFYDFQAGLVIQIDRYHVFGYFVVISFVSDVWSVSAVEDFHFCIFIKLLDVLFRFRFTFSQD